MYFSVLPSLSRLCVYPFFFSLFWGALSILPHKHYHHRRCFQYFRLILRVNLRSSQFGGNDLMAMLVSSIRYMPMGLANVLRNRADVHKREWERDRWRDPGGELYEVKREMRHKFWRYILQSMYMNVYMPVLIACSLFGVNVFSS